VCVSKEDGNAREKAPRAPAREKWGGTSFNYQSEIKRVDPLALTSQGGVSEWRGEVQPIKEQKRMETREEGSSAPSMLRLIWNGQEGRATREISKEKGIF